MDIDRRGITARAIGLTLAFGAMSAPVVAQESSGQNTSNDNEGRSVAMIPDAMPHDIEELLAPAEQSLDFDKITKMLVYDQETQSADMFTKIDELEEIISDRALAGGTVNIWTGINPQTGEEVAVPFILTAQNSESEIQNVRTMVIVNEDGELSYFEDLFAKQGVEAEYTFLLTDGGAIPALRSKLEGIDQMFVFQRESEQLGYYMPVETQEITEQGLVELIPTPIEPPEPASAEPERARVNLGNPNSNANVRSGPGMQNGVVATIPDGTALTMVERDDSGWDRVQFEVDGEVREGWIFGGLVTEIPGPSINVSPVPVPLHQESEDGTPPPAGGTQEGITDDEAVATSTPIVRYDPGVMTPEWISSNFPREKMTICADGGLTDALDYYYGAEEAALMIREWSNRPININAQQQSEVFMANLENSSATYPVRTAVIVDVIQSPENLSGLDVLILWVPINENGSSVLMLFESGKLGGYLFGPQIRDVDNLNGFFTSGGDLMGARSIFDDSTVREYFLSHKGEVVGLFNFDGAFNPNHPEKYQTINDSFNILLDGDDSNDININSEQNSGVIFYGDKNGTIQNFNSESWTIVTKIEN